ncbi:MAG: hypothetical protein RLZZ417_327 [Bacteroidota bacterium]|jgi:outer membrane cobalamin receptor
MKNSKHLTFFLLLGLSTISKSIFAQKAILLEMKDSFMILNLNEIVYTASRVENKAFNSAESISLLNKKSLRLNTQRNIPEILLETPGVMIQKTNHGGGSAIMRGLTGNQILYLIDGIRINNAITRFGPNQYLNTMDRFSIDRIEVLKGSGSVLFGSDAIGGVINILSIEPFEKEKDGFSSKILARLGSSNLEKSLHGRLGYQKKNSWITTGVTTRAFGDLIGGKETKFQRPSGYNELGIDIKSKIQLDKRQSIIALVQYVNQQDVPVYHKYKLENFEINKMDPQKRILAYTAYTYSPDHGFLKRIKITPNFQLAQESRWSKKNNATLLRAEHDSILVFGLTSELNTFKQTGRWKWTGSHGFDGYFDKVNSQRIQFHDNKAPIYERGLYPNHAKQTSYAIFSNQHFESKTFQFSLGNRLQFINLKIPLEKDKWIELSPAAWVGNLFISHQIIPDFKLIYGLNTGFRAPNIDDLGSLGIVDFRYEIPNYDLKPEKSTQFQMGFKWNKKLFNWETYLYFNKLKNLIVRNRKGNEYIEGYPVFVKENAENGYIKGLESSFQLLLTRYFQVSGSITYTHGQNTSKDEPLRRIPPLFGYVNLQYQKEKYWAKIFLQMAGNQKRLGSGDIADNRIGPLGTPGWSIINLSNGIHLNTLEINLTLQNLFNVDYKFHGSGINGVGRTLIFGFSWSI